MKKIVSLIFSGVVFMSSTAFGFSDLTESHWAYQNVMNMHSRGFVSGFSDNTFKPNDALTRAQFITMMVKSLGIEESAGVKFDDIANHWAAEYINIAGSAMSDGTNKFNPEDEALREDVAMAIVRINGLEYSEYDVNTLNAFSDLHNIASNRRKYVAIAVENGFMKGNANGTFNPKGALTRAEGTAVIWNLLNSDSVLYKIEEIIQPMYDYVADFSEGLAVVKKDGKYGYIDKQGKQVIPLIYDEAKNYSGGLAIVHKNFQYGVINKSGEEVVPCIYDYVCFEDELIMLRKGRWGYTDRHGNEIVAPTYLAMPEFSEGLAAVRKDDKYGFIGKNGEELIPFIYDDADNFSEGVAHVKKEGKVGFIDKNQNEIILGNYEWVDSLLKKVGVVLINKNYKGAYIGNLDEETELFSYSYELNDELNAVVIIKEGKYGYIDENNVEIIPTIYDNVLEAKCEMLKVRKDDKWGYINKEGEEIVPCIYDGVENFSEEVAAVRKGDKWGYINKEGEEIVPCIYDGVEAFSEELAAVREGDKWGYINKAGKEIIPCIYEYAHDFVEGFAAVNLNKTCRYINKEGKEIALYNYDDVENFSEGMARVEKDGKWGFIKMYKIL